MSNDVGARPGGALRIRASARQALGPLMQKLRSLGVDSDTELDAVVGRIKVRAGIRRGEDTIVHINRTFQELRRLNILSKEGRAITVVDRERLARWPASTATTSTCRSCCRTGRSG